VAKVHSGEEILAKGLTPWVRRTNVSGRQTNYRRQTDLR